MSTAKELRAAGATPLVEMKDISISFGGIKAVDHVSIDVSKSKREWVNALATVRANP